jgi:hypothetical protein
MIEVLIDNNALVDLCSEKEYPNYLTSINELRATGILSLNFSIYPFLEQIEGIIDDRTFDKVKSLIIQAGRVSGGRLLLPTEYHLRKAIDILPEQELKSEAKYWSNILSMFGSFKNYDEFKSNLGALQVYLNKSKNWIYGGAQNVQDFTMKFIKSQKGRGQLAHFFANEQQLIEFRQFIFNILLKRFNLTTVRDIYPNIHQFDERVISVTYLANIYICYYERIYRGRAVKKSDHIDLEQIIYMDACDYLLTNDKYYRDLINACEYSDLTGRAISLKEFIGIIIKRPISFEKRAVHSTMYQRL